MRSSQEEVVQCRVDRRSVQTGSCTMGRQEVCTDRRWYTMRVDRGVLQ